MIKKQNLITLRGGIFICSAFFSSNFAFANGNSEINALRKELSDIRSHYEQRISILENKLSKDNLKENIIPYVDSYRDDKLDASDSKKVKNNNTRNIYRNKFNPSIGVVLNGKYSIFSKEKSEFSGFAIGEEGERVKEHFSLGESEINFSSNIDDKFYGSLTAAIVNEDGETKIELEEAFIKTTPGLGLPSGLEIKAGRSLWKLGYLNEHHAHSDDFSDRPLPYRVFLNKSFNDDGVEISYVLPTDLYMEIGGGSFAGNDFPLGNEDGFNGYSAYARIGGDIGDNQSWRFGLSTLSNKATTRRSSNEDSITFIGDTDLYISDLRYVFAPTGNAKNKEIILQGEYFYRKENGTYQNIYFDDTSSGWYAQAIYKFRPQWRVGLRYSKLISPTVPTGLIGSTLDSNTHDPESYAAMLDWTNSEFSRIRLQYAREELFRGNKDNQLTLQYVMTFGAHSVHKY